MKITHVSIGPSESATKNNRPVLTPELLAATGARYSRNNEGLESIVSKIDFNNTEKSVDGIFKMVDYGHASIADMAPVSMFIDDISMFLAYYLWSVCPTASGQESSSRYIKMSKDGLVSPDELGMPKELQKDWIFAMNKSFDSYFKAIEYWEDYAKKNEKETKIPKDLPEKQKERMRRNFVFDRARVYIPLACKTNMMMVMSARSWVALCVNLLSSPVKEFVILGERIKEELALVTPRLIKHAVRNDAASYYHQKNLQRCIGHLKNEYSQKPFLNILYGQDHEDVIVDDLSKRTNRYSLCGPSINKMIVNFGWDSIGMAEIRDLNRHRTGEKDCILTPVGFHAPQKFDFDTISKDILNKSRKILSSGDPTYIYWTLLGHEYKFEHTTTAAHYIYETELRTGIGAHYKYAEKLKETLGLWYEKYPKTKGIIFEGSSEPE